MFFGFTDEQVAFRDAVRDLLADACPPSAVRAAWSGEGPGWDPKLWTRLGEMGVLGALAPPAAGGLGLGEVDLVLVIEEAGRAALPGPIVEHAAVGLPLLVAAGRDDLAEAAAAGRIAVTFSDRPDRVGWGAVADVVLVADEGSVEEIDPRRCDPLASVDRSRRDVALSSWVGAPLAGGDGSLAIDRAALGTAAQLCGLAARLIEMTVDYVSNRRQFGVPVGSYQAVKHHLADALLALEHARPAVYRAAYTVATAGPDRGRDVSMAKVMAGAAASLAGRVALQCHGAIGYTWEHDLHLWLKRVWVLDRAFGERDAHRARVADAVLGSARLRRAR